ncbi:MAG: chromosome segregation protein SMC [Flammeovirgaceae bacterium]|nr:chromosome segregation protein SMC [Flammeovirgaceae bacterium]
MSESETKKGVNNRMILIIAMLVILAIINGVQYYMRLMSEQKHNEKLESKEVELRSTFFTLDSISGELDLKIQEIERLGGNIDSLIIYKEELEKEKEELRISRNLAQERFLKIKNKIEAYESLLKRKDKEITKLKEINDELLTENISLKSEKNTLNREINSLQSEKGQMQEKIAIAATLQAENIKFFSINKRGKEKEGSEFKTKQIEQLKISFNIEENPLAEIGAKTLILRIIEPEGSALYNVAAGSGTFEYNGKEIFYTANQEILFDNSKQMVTFNYDKGNEFKKGRHKVELYSDGEKIGEDYFIVK